MQPGVTNAPVDFTAVRIPCRAIVSNADAAQADTCVWLDGNQDTQALVLGRAGSDGGLVLKYLPNRRFAEDAQGAIHFSATGWRAGLPLKFFEDERFAVPGNERAAWLDGWHGELEWLRATHRTTYSNAIIGIHEHFHRPSCRRSTAPPRRGSHQAPPNEAAGDRRARHRGARQQSLELRRARVQSRGNHGSFLRVSTHATLMLAGGERTGIPQGLDVQEPYDTLSFIPTVFALTGQLDEQAFRDRRCGRKGSGRSADG
jgi:hypothetical protein